MNWLVGTVLVLFALLGGVGGWWKGSKDLANPPGRYDRPIGVGRREHERSLQKRYRRRRILLTVVGTVAATAVGFGLLVLAATRRWFR
ncbi:hypothetical protein BH11PSE3_BH11PSE3_33940 [soil metagenome]